MTLYITANVLSNAFFYVNKPFKALFSTTQHLFMVLYLFTNSYSVRKNWFKRWFYDLSCTNVNNHQNSVKSIERL